MTPTIYRHCGKYGGEKSGMGIIVRTPIPSWVPWEVSYSANFGTHHEPVKKNAQWYEPIPFDSP
jgi:hypothetical protein